MATKTTNKHTSCHKLNSNDTTTDNAYNTLWIKMRRLAGSKTAVWWLWVTRAIGKLSVLWQRTGDVRWGVDGDREGINDISPPHCNELAGCQRTSGAPTGPGPRPAGSSSDGENTSSGRRFVTVL